jgi:serine/threonine-protein kinase HipA
MRLAPGTPLSIALAFEPSSEPLAVGRLAMDAGLAQLEWSTEVIARSLPVSPLYYPPEPGLMAARNRSFDGLHGFLADSLPDGWGYLLMRKRLAKLGIDIASLSPLERLALVGEHGRGALAFKPATTPADDVESLDLDALAHDATALLMGDQSRLADTLAGLAGGSGGARPKVQVGFDGQGHVSVGEGEIATGHTAWLVKFRAPSDPIDIGPIEEAYACMAEAAGLHISAHRLLPAKTGPGYFATRRFDRPDGGGRLHMVSLAGAIEAPSEAPSSYDMFLRATRAITRRADDVAAAFRRMVFNVLACNPTSWGPLASGAWRRRSTSPIQAGQAESIISTLREKAGARRALMLQVLGKSMAWTASAFRRSLKMSPQPSPTGRARHAKRVYPKTQRKW